MLVLFRVVGDEAVWLAVVLSADGTGDLDR